MTDGTAAFLRTLQGALAGGPGSGTAFTPSEVDVSLPEGGSWPSLFAVSDLAQATVGAAGGALASFVGRLTGSEPPAVEVLRDLASGWFFFSLQPIGWTLGPAWDPIAGDYEGSDGWIKLHTNAAHHRAAALRVLGCDADRAAVAAAVGRRAVRDLEDDVVAAGGAAAALRSVEEWDAHPQGQAAQAEPLVLSEPTDLRGDTPGGASFDPTRPLSSIRVLDLTRVLAGPVATRFLAGYGAQVLRIDPPGWDEPAIVPEVTVGKRCARLDLRREEDRLRFLELLAEADVLVHGYRSDALDRLGLGAEVRAACRPGLVDVSLDAYGWSGPWCHRRGFDSLVQMSSGIADAGMRKAGADRPVSLPVQALDHATGYLLAAAALTGLEQRAATGAGSRWRTSLARMAALLIDGSPDEPADPRPLELPPSPSEPDPSEIEHTAWGPATRLAVPLRVAGCPLRWDRPAVKLGADDPAWW